MDKGAGDFEPLLGAYVEAHAAAQEAAKAAAPLGLADASALIYRAKARKLWASRQLLDYIMLQVVNAQLLALTASQPEQPKPEP